jgi:translation initiation factor 5B
MDSEQTLEKQKAYVRSEFETRTAKIMTEFAEEGLNAALYWQNPDVRKFISVVPTSARTGEGVCDLLLLMMHLVQRFLENKVAFKNELQCTVLEVKPIQGIGMTIDVVLVNGKLREGDTIVLCGLNGPIVTEIRSLLTPQPMREMRVKSEYIHH